MEARLERDEPLRDNPELANVWDGERKPPVMRAKLAEQDRAGLDRSAVRFGVVDAYDLLVPVREHAGFPTIAKKLTRIDPQFLKNAQQGRITEQVHRLNLQRKAARRASKSMAPADSACTGLGRTST